MKKFSKCAHVFFATLCFVSMICIYMLDTNHAGWLPNVLFLSGLMVVSALGGWFFYNPRKSLKYIIAFFIVVICEVYDGMHKICKVCRRWMYRRKQCNTLREFYRRTVVECDATLARREQEHMQADARIYQQRIKISK